MMEISIEQYNKMAERLTELEYELSESVKVVRCKDCKNRMHDEERELYYCMMFYGQGDVSDNNYCQWGERKGGDD